jgi:hypothetical protein
VVNSRQLAESVATSLGKPLTSTLQHAKNLREAKGAKTGAPLVTAGGRGRNAPAMSRADAATLICAILGSGAVQDSVSTVEWMRELKAEFHGYRFKGHYRHSSPRFDVTIGVSFRLASHDLLDISTSFPVAPPPPLEGRSQIFYRIIFCGVNRVQIRMVNSRQLAEQVARSLGQPLTSTLQHAKNLREAKGASDGPLVTAGGRGRNAPAMSRKDAASLICAVLGSGAVQDSVETIESMRRLKAGSPRQRFWGDFKQTHRGPPIELGVEPEHNVMEALACVLRFFDQEEEFLRNQIFFGTSDPELYAVFEVEFPHHYASLTVGVRNMFSETWTYGRRMYPRNEQLRRLRQDAMREISEVLR